MIENEEYEYPADLQEIDNRLYGKAGKDGFHAREILRFKAKYRETGNADWLIHAARAVTSLSDAARAKLARAGIITGGALDHASLFPENYSRENAVAAITPANARMLKVSLTETHYFRGHKPDA